MTENRDAIIAEAREFMDPMVGYSWTSWWDEKQAGELIRKLLSELEE